MLGGGGHDQTAGQVGIALGRAAEAVRADDACEGKDFGRILGALEGVAAGIPVVGGADGLEAVGAAAAGPQCLVGGHGGHGGELGIHHAVLIQLAQVVDRVEVPGVLHVGGDGAVLEQGVRAIGDAVRAEDGLPLGRLGHGQHQTDGVVLAVAVRILIGEGVQHVVELVQVGGNLHAQLLQPVRADGVVIDITTLSRDDHIGGAVDAVGGRLGQVFAGVGEDVLAVLGQQVVQRLQHALGDEFLRVGQVSGKHVGQVARGDQGVELGGEVAGGALDGLHAHADSLLDLLKHQVVLVGRGADLEQPGDLGRLLLGRRGKRAQAQQQAQGKNQGQQFLHGAVPPSYNEYSIINPLPRRP